MRLILCENYDEMSKKCTELIAGLVHLKPDCVLGLATGSTPVGTYERLSELYKNGDLDFSDVKTFNLDEYYPLEASNSQSYHTFMQENLFGKVNLKPENTHLLDGMAKDPDKECADFDKMIDETDGIDLQLLGIGRNGHIGFNEPEENLYTGTHVTDLTQSTIEANARFFNSMDEVPTKALTMGIATIMKSKKIVILANGKAKHEAVSALLNDRITTACPATMLKMHPDVVLICDKEAYEG